MGIPHITGLDATALDALARYDWPGNVRELRNVLERALILCRESTITSDHLSMPQGPKDFEHSAVNFPLKNFSSANTPMPQVIHQTKHFLVTEALKKCGGSIKDAATLLGISRESLKHHIRSLGIRGWKATSEGCKTTTTN